MSAEIPWTVGPGEALTPAPPLPRTAPEPEAAVEATSEPIYTQAQYEAERIAFAEAFSNSMRVRLEGERDRALIECQRLRAVAAYWQAKAEGR